MGRTRGCLWLAAGVVVAILAGVVAFAALNGAAGSDREGAAGRSTPTVPVVVVLEPVPIGAVLSAPVLEVRDVDAAVVPTGALASVEEAVGKITLTDLYAGEVVVAARLADPTAVSNDGRVALVLADGQVLMALPAQDLMSQIGMLKAGDRVDLLFSLEFPTDRNTGAGAANQEELATFNLLQNVTIAAVVSTQAPAQGQPTAAPDALLLTISPQDALTLKYVRDAGGILDIVLRTPGDEQPVETDPVDVDYMIDRYQIPTEVGR